jgi:hypothetical protein
VSGVSLFSPRVLDFLVLIPPQWIRPRQVTGNPQVQEPPDPSTPLLLRRWRFWCGSLLLPPSDPSPFTVDPIYFRALID